MQLQTLLSKAGFSTLGDSEKIDVAAITADSRRVGPGTLFVAIRGSAGDGHLHLEEAFTRGAVAAVVERADRVPAVIPHIVAANTREALDHLAANIFEEPAREMRLIGVTGTNGKTTLV